MTMEARSSTTGTPTGAQHVPGLLPAAQMLRQLGSAPAQAAEVHDPSHSRGASCLPEVAGGRLVQGREGVSGAHGVDEVVGRVDAGQRRGQGAGIEAIALHDLGRRGHAPGQGLRPPGQAAHLGPGPLEGDLKPPPT